MALARWQASILDSAGNVMAGASIEVRREISGQPLVQLYSDRGGTLTLGNPFSADADGFAGFHVAGGAYQVRAYTGPSGSPTFERIWRYVPIGLAQETDFFGGDTPVPRIVTAAGAVAIAADDRVVCINKTVGEATTVNLPTALGRQAAVTIKDLKGDAASNVITVTPNGAETIDGAASFVIDFNHGAATFRPLPDGSGWFIA